MMVNPDAKRGCKTVTGEWGRVRGERGVDRSERKKEKNEERERKEKKSVEVIKKVRLWLNGTLVFHKMTLCPESKWK
jgi:hypothetical protein